MPSFSIRCMSGSPSQSSSITEATSTTLRPAGHPRSLRILVPYAAHTMPGSSSTAPRPNTLPSSSLPWKGSWVHAAGSPTPTQSM